MTRSPELDAVIDMIRAAGLVESGASIQDRRALLEGVATPVADDVSVEPVDAGGTAAEWVRAPGVAAPSTDGPVVVHLHGGGYTSGSCNTHRTFGVSLSAQVGAPVLMVDYRLAPEHPFPAALDDAVAALAWVTDSVGIDASRVVLSGDSAGGGLAVSALVARRDAGAAPIAGAVLLSPWADLAMVGASHDTEVGADPMCSRSSLGPSAEAYRGEAPADDPGVSPAYADLSGLPPLLFHVGQVEVLRDDSVVLA